MSLFGLIINLRMLRQRQQSNDKECLYKEQREVQKYFSVKADVSFKQNTTSLPRGRIIRNQISKSNVNCLSQFDNNKTRTLTPQCVKAGNEKKRKKSQLEDIRSFKLEQSNVNSKYLTIKKDLKQNGSEKTKKGQTIHHNTKIESTPKQMGNGILNLNEGWVYKGEYSSGVFHGYGQLLYHKQIVYKGKFQYGYFHGYGKLQNCELFSYLVQKGNLRERLKELFKKQIEIVSLDDTNWTAYIGEFKKGQLSGYGQLWMKSYKIVGNWQRGRLKKKVVLIMDDK